MVKKEAVCQAASRIPMMRDAGDKASRRHRLLLGSKTVDLNRSNRRGSKMRPPEGKWVRSQAPGGRHGQ
jgi:hypothetical protein